MAARDRDAAKRAEHEFFVTRVFDAPRSLVFRAWTDPKLAAQWWGPQGFTTVHLEMDVRPGGAWRKCMRSPDGAEFWRRGVYREVTEPERLVLTYVTDDPDSKPGHETLVTVVFTEQGGKTEMSFRQEFFDTPASRDAHAGGWTSSFERFAGFITEQRAAS